MPPVIAYRVDPLSTVAHLGRTYTDDVFRRAARRVKEWRKLHDDLTQAAFAARAKISIGCLQGFEAGTRVTRQTNLAKIAAAIGLTPDQLLAEDDPLFVRPHPLLKDLRPEDLQLANAFHHAGAEVKHAIKTLFSADISDDQRERLALLLKKLLTLPPEIFVLVERFIVTGTPAPPPVSTPIPTAVPTDAPRRRQPK